MTYEILKSEGYIIDYEVKTEQNKSNLKINTNEETENSLNDTKNLTSELNKLNELLKSGVITQEEFEKAKKKILDD